MVAFLGPANMLEEMSGHALAVSIPSSYLKADHSCIFCKQTSMQSSDIQMPSESPGKRIGLSITSSSTEGPTWR